MDDREAFVQTFDAGWRSGRLEPFIASFVDFIDPDVRLVQPPLPTARGWDGFVRFATALYEMIPDLRGEVVGWKPTAKGVSVDLVLTGTLAGKPLRLHTRDEIELRDGRILRRRAHLDPGLLLRAMMRPRALPRLARAFVAIARG